MTSAERSAIFTIPPSPLVVLIVLTCIVYGNSLLNGFVWDDWELMVRNDAYISFDLSRIFLSKANALEYLPVRDLTLAIDAQIWGMRPFGFHVMNLIFYLLGVAALYILCKDLALLVGAEGGAFIAFWTALIFALHPLHAEVVNGIAFRNNILAMLFLAVSLDVLIRGLCTKKSSLFALSLLLFIMALLSKASAIFFPAFLAAVLALVPDTVASKKHRVLLFMAFAIIDIGMIWLHYANAVNTKMIHPAFQDDQGAAFLMALVRAPQIVLFYLKMLLFPFSLTVEYRTLFLWDASVAWSLLSLTVMAAMLMATWKWKKEYPLLLLGVSWFLLSLVPVLNLFPTYPVVADRYAYPAVLGFALAASQLLKIAVERRKALIYLAWCVVLAWGIRDVTRNRDWRSDITLWTSAIAADPNTSRRYIAIALWKELRFDDALAHLKTEQERTGTFYYDQYLGRLYYMMGLYPEALTSYRRALTAGGSSWKDVNLETAQAFEKMGDDRAAIVFYNRVIQIPVLDPLNRDDTAARAGIERITRRMKRD